MRQQYNSNIITTQHGNKCSNDVMHQTICDKLSPIIIIFLTLYLSPLYIVKVSLLKVRQLCSCVCVVRLNDIFVKHKSPHAGLSTGLLRESREACKLLLRTQPCSQSANVMFPLKHMLQRVLDVCGTEKN